MLAKHKLRNAILGMHQAPPEVFSENDLVQTLVEQLETLSDIVVRQAETMQAARHLLNTLAMRGQGGPVFVLRDDTTDDEVSNAILVDAVLNLVSQIEGTEPPHFCLPVSTN